MNPLLAAARTGTLTDRQRRMYAEAMRCTDPRRICDLVMAACGPKRDGSRPWLRLVSNNERRK